MYNIVKIDKKCPKCRSSVEWQSKSLTIDGMYPIANILGIFDLNKRITGEAHTLCHKCKIYLEVFIKNGKVIDDSKEINKIKKSAKELEERAEEII